MSGLAMSDPPPGGPSRSRRKPAAENWDDDFDFDLRMQDRGAAPRQSSSSASARTHSHSGSLAALTPAHPLSKKSSQLSSKSGASRANSTEEPLVLAFPPGGKGKGKVRAASKARDEVDAIGYDEEDDDAWDASPPRLGHGRPSLSLSTRRVSKGQAQPSPLVIPPRTSSAASSTSPLSPSPSPLDGSYPQPTPHTAPPVGPNKLMKRHPSSSSFAPHSGNRYADPNSSTSSLGSWSHLNRSTPSPGAGPPVSAANATSSATQRRTRQIRHMKSGDMMPPPPVPVQRRRSERTKRDSRAQPQGVVPSVPEGAIPLPPSQEQLDAAQKPGFWRRMSADEQRRRRSSSVGSPTKLRPTAVDAPPIPPLPANLRSPSSASTTSYHSGTSSVSVSMSTSTSMSRSNLGLSSILRRSTSNLANKLKGRSGPNGVEGVRVASGTSTHSMQSRGSRSSSQQSFSRRYHLPSPSPQSPYAEQVPLPPPLLSTMAQSHSYGPSVSHAIDAEDDEDGVQATPRKRRPVSTVPPRSAAWSGEAWSGFPADGSVRRAGSPTKRTGAAALAPPLQPEPPLPPTPTEEAPRFATLKRLSSLSKKHGRRLSGGWKFGTSSSTSSEERPKLETVVGSPSKSGRVSPGKGATGVGLGLGLDAEAAAAAEAAQDERETRSGSLSVPGSMFKSTPSRSLAETFDKLEGRGVVGTPESASSSKVRNRSEKETRRQSWNDFVIPRNVLEKQRGLKEGIKEVKRFATGVETLKTLLSTHAALLSRVSAADGQTKAAFANIEKEFGQWWEMATVLIEVGSTGQGTAGSAASVEAPASPKRSRRITLASDEAQLASDMIRSRTVHETGASISVQSSRPLPTHAKSSFLPSPSLGVDDDPYDFDSLSGPPRASPDHWRASTGRQDLSKRQLEVLRTMLRTPVSDPTVPARPHLVRGLSGLSTISAGTGAAVRASSPGLGGGVLGTPGGHGARPSISRSGSTFAALPRMTPASSPLAPSPSPRLHSHPPVSFSPAKSAGMAIPASASGQRLRIKEQEGEGGSSGGKDARPRQMRRASKVGLAGLKDFIRSLKGKERGSGSTSASASASASGDITPASAPLSVAIERTITREITLSPPNSAGLEKELARRTSQVSVGDGAGSPTPRRRWVRPKDEDRGGGRAPPAPLPLPLPSPVLSPAPDSAYSSGTVRETKEEGGGVGVAGGKGRRPGLRGIFRGGSGNWGELVSGAAAKSPTYPVPPHTAPIPPTTRQSSDPVRPVGGLRGGGESHSVRSTPGTMRLDDGAFAGIGQSGDDGRDFGASRQSLGGSDVAKGPGADMEADGDNDMTVRPRKSRILGLGWPEAAPSLPSHSMQAQGLPGRSSSGQSAQSVQSAVSRGSRVGGVPGWSGTGGVLGESSRGVNAGGAAGNRDVSGSTASSRTVSDSWSEESESGRTSHVSGSRAARALSSAIVPHAHAAPRASNESGRSDVTNGTTDSVLDAAGVIALTPENLPVLLEYLRQCQGKLAEWRVRVDGLGLGSGE